MDSLASCPKEVSMLQCRQGEPKQSPEDTLSEGHGDEEFNEDEEFRSSQLDLKREYQR